MPASSNRIENQINQPIAYGDMVVHGDTIIYQSGLQIPRNLTAIPYEIGRLIGRETELTLLASRLQRDRVVLLNGMGGVGKTALATAFVNLNPEQYTHIAWVEQISDIFTSLTTDTSLVRNLQITLAEDPAQDARYLLNQLGSLKGPSLLIIDNAEEDLEELRAYLPRENWQIIITSRQQLAIGQQLDLDNLQTKEAQELFFSYYNRDQNVAAVQQVIEILDHHTLSLEILAKTAQARRMQPLTKVVQLLTERGLEIGRKADVEIEHNKGKKVDRFFSYIETVFKWTAAEDHETYYLSRFLFLPPIFHPFELLTRILYIEEDSDLWDYFTSALDSLVEKGWLRYNPQLGYKMHRVIRESLYRYFYDELIFDLHPIVGVKKMLQHNQYKDDITARFPLLIYGESVLNTIKPEWLTEEGVAPLIMTVGSIYEDMGELTKAVKFKEDALKYLIAGQGEDYEWVDTYQSNLAVTYMAVGKYKEAINLLEDSIRRMAEKSKVDKKDKGVRFSNLGIAYDYYGDAEKAYKYKKEALDLSLEMNGEDHLITALRQHNLACYLSDQQNYSAAVVLYEKSLQTVIDQLGKNHTSYILRSADLGFCYYDLGDEEKAKELLDNVLEKAIAQLGEEHIRVALIYYQFGQFNVKSEKWGAAKLAYQKCWEIRNKVLGPDHKDTVYIAGIIRDLPGE